MDFEITQPRISSPMALFKLFNLLNRMCSLTYKTNIIICVFPDCFDYNLKFLRHGSGSRAKIVENPPKYFMSQKTGAGNKVQPTLWKPESQQECRCLFALLEASWSVCVSVIVYSFSKNNIEGQRLLQKGDMGICWRAT